MFESFSNSLRLQSGTSVFLNHPLHSNSHIPQLFIFSQFQYNLELISPSYPTAVSPYVCNILLKKTKRTALARFSASLCLHSKPLTSNSHAL